MGWWAVTRGDEELIQGDEPYDILAAALGNIVREYEKDCGRRPTVQELLLTVEVVLSAGTQDYASDGDHLELVSVAGRTKKRRKQQRFRVGDFFAIPLPAGLGAFGRILSDVRSDYGMLVGIYERVARRMPRPEELQGGSFLFEPFCCNPAAWRT
jgi:hypothetical protein